MINVVYRSSFRDPSGYGAASREYLSSLNKIKDLNIVAKTKRFWTGGFLSLDPAANKLLSSLEANDIPASTKYILLQQLTPENFYIDPMAYYHIAYTPFETDRCPKHWLLNLRAMDEVWVPSKVNRDAYIKSGIQAEKVHVIPHGVNLDRFNPEIKPLSYKKSAFNFGSCFDWTERKGGKDLVQAFLEEFKEGEDVSLTLKSFWKFPLDQSRNEIKKQIKELVNKKGIKDYNKNIHLWPDILEDKSMPGFYTSLDCFVLPTRGEGWGLPFSEAMACGVPCIGPKEGGSTEFMNEDNSFLIDGGMVIADDPDAPAYNGHRWFQCDVKSLRKLMREAYTNTVKTKELSIKAAEDMKTRYTWDMAAEMMYKRLTKITTEKGYA